MKKILVVAGSYPTLQRYVALAAAFEARGLRDLYEVVTAGSGELMAEVERDPAAVAAVVFLTFEFEGLLTALGHKLPRLVCVVICLSEPVQVYPNTIFVPIIAADKAPRPEELTRVLKTALRIH